MRHVYRLLMAAAVVGTFLLCVCAGSVAVPVGETLRIIGSLLRRVPLEHGAAASIIATVRLPRVLCTALTGASLSLCGCAMQGLLRNPLADGGTLGVSGGASLGAVLAILLGISVPGLPFAGTAVMAMLFAFLSLCLVLLLAFQTDRTLHTNTIILMGVIYSMFVSAVMNLLVTFAGNKLRTVTFWTMGSLASATWAEVWLLLGALVVFGTVLLMMAGPLNVLSVGEEQALHLGVDVRRVKLTVMIAASALIGVCVSVGGSIAFVGLVTPHILRLLTGPDHKRLMAGCLSGGAVLLMLCDLCARTLLAPLELPLGAVTSLIGACVFVWVLLRRKGGQAC